ncbi:SitI3 family protein [Actinophytocola sp.]|uniref:SitI3 family protein n=1 Tax=Actinophytocola sp. TaxID=1872138 RepID=UPI003D6BD51C
MAISYSFALATQSSAPDVARELLGVGRILGVLDTSATAEGLLDGMATGLGTWILVFEAKARPWDPVANDLGFTPTVSVTFRLDKDDDIGYQQDDLVRLVSGLLDRVPGDAVLHREFEDIWLLRRGGEVTLSEQDDIWPPHRRAALSQRFERVTHSFSQE